MVKIKYDDLLPNQKKTCMSLKRNLTHRDFGDLRNVFLKDTIGRSALTTQHDTSLLEVYFAVRVKHARSQICQMAEDTAYTVGGVRVLVEHVERSFMFIEPTGKSRIIERHKIISREYEVSPYMDCRSKRHI